MGTGSFRKIKPTNCCGITTSVRVYRGGSRKFRNDKSARKSWCDFKSLEKKKALTSTLTRLYKKSGERGHSLSLLDPHMVKRTKLSSTDINYIWPVWGCKAVSYLSHDVFYLFIIIHHITDDYN